MEPAKKRTDGGFHRGALITTHDLRDDQTLLRLWRGACLAGHSRTTGPDLLTYFTCAEEALAAGEDPGALFVSLVRGRGRDRLSGESEDRARRRLLRLKGLPGGQGRTKESAIEETDRLRAYVEDRVLAWRQGVQYL